MTGKKPDKNIKQSSEVVLEAVNLFKENKLNNVSFKLNKGEVLGIAGLQGHGQTELLHAIFGDGPVDSGEIKINNNTVKIKNERDALKNGIALVPEDRKNEGLLLMRSIKENISLMSLNKIQKLGIISEKVENEKISEAVSRLSIKAPSTEQAVTNLSGGNQQKVVISKAVLTNGKILLLSDPTRGIDVGTKAEIYNLILELAKEGLSIIFFSTEMSEFVALCNRVLVFKQGQIAVELLNDEVTEKNIINAAVGLAKGEGK